MIAALQKKYSDRVHFVLIDVEKRDDSRTVELMKKYKINYIPYYVFFDREGEVVDNFSGSISPEDLGKKIISLIK